MKIAYVHVLPLEYYPPATNTLAHFATRSGWDVHTWTTPNARGLPRWSHDSVSVTRMNHGNPQNGFLRRAAGYASWHSRVALALRAWNPDVVIAVEPHSMLAVSLYYSMLGGRAPLFIHYHEYYSSEDYSQPGMRLLRMARRIDGDALLERAKWISQTNEARLRLMLAGHERIRPDSGKVLPNYPPAEWVEQARSLRHETASGKTRLLYVGSASLEDTFIGELATWVKERPSEFSLHVVGDNITSGVWHLLTSLGAPNITTEPRGRAYDDLPELLAHFDVGLVLYKGNTLNFVHNVPNKTFEYLAAGLEVWYPPEMDAMRTFRQSQPQQRLREIDFKALANADLPRVEREPPVAFDFTCEAMLKPLIAEIEKAGGSRN